MRRLVCCCLLWLYLSGISGPVIAGGNKVLTIYLDADRTHHRGSAISMEMGIKTAFSEVNNQIQGYNIKFLKKDHRGNSVRSKLHMKQFADDKNAIFILAGLHSPPLIKNRQFINKQKILTLVPWAAAGPITRFPDKENWIFRLSIDDSKAGYRMVDFAVKKTGCKEPALLLEETPWGQSNQNTMSKAINETLHKKAKVNWFNWNTKVSSAKIILRNIIAEGADCILFVGNSPEGKTFSKAMVKLDKKIPIISHWGIVGGNFHQVINAKMRQHLELYFIQSCFSFISSTPTSFSRSVLSKARSLFPEVKRASDIPAPTGFIHAYDLGRLVIAALSQIKLGDDIKVNRNNLRLALENINKPVQGLIKTYHSPFSQFSEKNVDAHEALGLQDFCMGKFGKSNEIIVMER